MQRFSKLPSALVLSGLTVALLGPSVWQFFEVDSCLDTGRVFDYINQICRDDVITLQPGSWFVGTSVWSVVPLFIISSCQFLFSLFITELIASSKKKTAL